jgi:hypothetical protein
MKVSRRRGRRGREELEKGLRRKAILEKSVSPADDRGEPLRAVPKSGVRVKGGNPFPGWPRSLAALKDRFFNSLPQTVPPCFFKEGKGSRSSCNTFPPAMSKRNQERKRNSGEKGSHPPSIRKE